MEASALRWVLAGIGLLVIGGVYLFTVHQNRMRRRHAFRTLTQEELKEGVIEDESLREELSNISDMLNRQDAQADEGLADIHINPALDASIKPHSSRKQLLRLPLPMQRIADENLVGHVLKHVEDQLLTATDLREAFTHVGLVIGKDGLLTPDDYRCFKVANLTDNGDFFELGQEQFATSGFVCFFDVTALDRPCDCYEIMLKVVDELVRLLDLRVFNEQLQLLTLKHVTDTRERLRKSEDG